MDRKSLIRSVTMSTLPPTHHMGISKEALMRKRQAIARRRAKGSLLERLKSMAPPGSIK